MNAEQVELVRKWIEALRSGEYKKAKHLLMSLTKTQRKPSFCCLGVLCEIKGVERQDDFAACKGYYVIPQGQTAHRHDTSIPEEIFQEWTGLLTQDEMDYHGDTLRDDLMARNDGGMSFKHIANLIEKRLEERISS